MGEPHIIDASAARTEFSVRAGALRPLERIGPATAKAETAYDRAEA